MGAWGMGPFDNDSGLDFLDQLTETPSWSEVIKLLERVATQTTYLEAPDASEAVAAAAFVAAIVGDYHLPDDYQDLPQRLNGHASGNFFKQIFQKPQPSLSAVRRLGVKAIARILAPDSELEELWLEGVDGEGSDYQIWRQSLIDIRKILETI